MTSGTTESVPEVTSKFVLQAGYFRPVLLISGRTPAPMEASRRVAASGRPSTGRRSSARRGRLHLPQRRVGLVDRVARRVDPGDDARIRIHVADDLIVDAPSE